MKFVHKIILVASSVITLSFCISAMVSYINAQEEFEINTHHVSLETLEGVSQAVKHWMNGKIAGVNLLGEVIENGDLSFETLDAVVHRPVLSKEFEGVVLGFESDGRMVKNLDNWQPDADFDARTRPWYGLALKHDRTMITSPYEDAETGGMLISVTRKIFSGGQIFGVLLGDVSLKNLLEMMNAVNQHEQHYVFLFADNGMIISHPDANLNGKNLRELIGDEKLDLRRQKAFQDLKVQGQQFKVMLLALDDLPTENQWILGIVQDTSVMDKKAQEMAWWAIASTLLAIVLSILVLSWSLNRLMQPLRSVSHALKTIRYKNDLTQRLEENDQDEFGDLAKDVNKFLAYLQNMVFDLKEQSHAIRKKTDRIVTSTEKIDHQATEVERLANSMQEMSRAAEHFSVSNQRLSDAILDVENGAKSGVEKLSGVTESVGVLSAEMSSAVDSIGRLSELSSQIGSIVTSISSISDQTNLLALNASIEAARAGEAGRGFAVVADEVRALAGKTQQATEEIDAMIRSLQSQTSHAQEEIEQSRRRTEEVRAVAHEADEMFTQIQVSIGDINALTESTAAAVEEQSAMAGVINDNTRDLRDISQNLQNAVTDQMDIVETTAQLIHQQDQALARVIV